MREPIGFIQTTYCPLFGQRFYLEEVQPSEMKKRQKEFTTNLCGKHRFLWLFSWLERYEMSCIEIDISIQKATFL